MQVIPSFDPSAALSGNINVNAADAGCKVLLYNLSIYAIQLNFEDGATAVLHPGEANHWTLNDPTPTIAWTQYKKLNVNSPAISTVTVQLFRQDEEIEGTYPTFFGYQFNVGNTLTVSQGAFQVLQNDGNASGTVIAEATVTGSPGSNVIIQNQGLIQILQWIGGALTQIFKTDPGAASVIKFANTGLLAEVLGNLKVDGTTELVGNATLDGTLGVNGTTSLAGLIAAATLLSSLSVTNNASVGGTLGVTGASTLAALSATTLSTSGLATLASALLNGVLTFANNTNLQWKDNGGVARNIMTVDGSNNTIIHGVTTNDQILLQNASGSIQVIVDLVNGLLNVPAKKQTLTGSTSGTMDIYEFLSGAVKIVIGVQTNFQQGAAAINVATLKTAFTTVAFILNFGNGGVVTANAGVADTNRQITWGTGTAGGTQVNNTQIPQNAAGFTVAGFTAVGSAGSYAGAHGGICCWIGI
jgi:fibronectin-binding autotransporter adhesin